ncbi:MAG: endonuclease domain-containing protein [Deltaproteobacteria bacterium]
MKYIYNEQTLRERRKGLRRSQTDAEKLLWGRLRYKQVYGLKFYRQFSVGPYILDFFCPQIKLAVELDGGQHAEEENKEYDAVRTSYLKEMGIEVLRFWNNEVIQNVEGALSEISRKSNSSQPPLV